YTATTAEITVSVAGVYTLKVTDSDNGCSAEDTVTVGEDITAPTADAGSDVDLTCTAESITLTGSGNSTNPEASLSYAWSGPNGYTATTAEITVSVAGVYTLTVTDSDNGCSAEDTVTVGQNADKPTADAGADVELTCTTTSVILSGSGNSTNADADLSYSWSGPNGYTANTAEITVSEAGNYTFIVTDNNNGCSAEDTVTVGEDITAPTADAGSDVELTCTTMSVMLSGSGNST
ncbi:PKD domain-containing protein, partial [Gelidibacter sp. F2691]|nr:PKD domain-containing protein [Gelidibacter sp. F2691]